MPHGEELRFTGVSKRFGAVTAVDDLTATVSPGAVTGFLGPNGAGKTTTLRMLLGLVAPTSGTATVGGVAYRDLRDPLRSVGAALEASSFHPGRTGANHLKVAARAASLPDGRVDEVLGIVGLSDAAGRKVGGYSLGMRQRLGLAAAMLGDPGVLVLDEPVNGLDPEGIRWMRGLLQGLAREGRTVLVSSHLLAEVQQTADQLLVIAHGRLVYAGRIEELLDPDDERTVFDGPDRAALAAAMSAAGIPFEVLRSGLTARHVEPVAVGRAAAATGAVLSSLQRRGPSLEEVFLGLVDGSRVQRPRERTDEDEAVRALPTGTVPLPATAPVPDGVPPADPDPVVESVPGADPVGGPAAEPTPAPEPTPAAEPTPGSEAVEGPTGSRRSFAVAATGVIDVVHADADADRETDADAAAVIGTDGDPETDADAAADNGTDADRDAKTTRDHDSALAPGRSDDEWEAMLSAGDRDDHADEAIDEQGSNPRRAVDGPIERVWTWQDADEAQSSEDRR